MRKITLSFLIVALSLMLAAVAFAVDIPNISTWTQSMGTGGGGPGRGDVLVAPYYDVRTLTDPRLPGTAGTTAQEQFTLFCLVNTDTVYGTIARVRFREWKRSRECLDIDIPMTTNDVWCGEISRLPAGGGVLHTPTGGGERWVNTERVSTATTTGGVTYTYGYFTGELFPAAGIEFRTFDIESEETNKLARCEYGYIEIFGEERVSSPTTTAEPWRFPRVGNTDPNPATHLGDDVDVKDVLMGYAMLIRPVQAISHQYAMNALSDFAVNVAGIWSSTTTAFPNFWRDVQGGPGTFGANPGIGGFDQLEAILSKRYVYLQYVTGTDPADPSLTPTSTSAVITFPTKHFHYARTGLHLGGVGSNHQLAPFTGVRETLNDHLLTDIGSPTAISACSVGENVRFFIYDRKENTFDPGSPISPPPVVPPGKLPYEVNVIGFYPLDRPPDPPYFRDNITVATSGGGRTFYSGYIFVDLGNNGQGRDNVLPFLVPPGFDFFGNKFLSYNGLPTYGVVLTELFNDSVLGYYGNTIHWRYAVEWFPFTPAP